VYAAVLVENSLMILGHLQRFSSRITADTPCREKNLNIQAFQENNICKHSTRENTHTDTHCHPPSVQPCHPQSFQPTKYICIHKTKHIFVHHIIQYFFVASLENPWSSLFHLVTMSLVDSFFFSTFTFFFPAMSLCFSIQFSFLSFF
jgi:hypothetical protein